jgi:hypothetical protein
LEIIMELSLSPVVSAPDSFPKRSHEGGGRLRQANPFDVPLRSAREQGVGTILRFPYSNFKNDEEILGKAIKQAEASATYLFEKEGLDIGLDKAVEEDGTLVLRVRSKRVVNRKPKTTK